MRKAAQYSLVIGIPVLGALWLVNSLADPAPSFKRRVHEAVDDFVATAAAKFKPVVIQPHRPATTRRFVHRPVTETKFDDAMDGDKHLRWTTIWGDRFAVASFPDAPPPLNFDTSVGEPPVPPTLTFDDTGDVSGSVSDFVSTSTPVCTPGSSDLICLVTECDQLTSATARCADEDKSARASVAAAPIAPPVGGGIGPIVGGGGRIGGVPEPSTWVMMIVSFALMGWLTLRRAAPRR